VLALTGLEAIQRASLQEPVGRSGYGTNGPSRSARGDLRAQYLDFAEPTDFTGSRLAVGRLPDS
jgi:hypothetical protein